MIKKTHVIILCAMAWMTSMHAQPSELLNQAIERVYPALVRLDVVSVVPDDGRMAKRRSFGSGAIISKQGYVVTNHHVAGKAVVITCRLSDGTLVPAKLIGTDPLADIAVVQLTPESDTPDWPVAEFGDSDSIQVGDTLYAMGSPAALSQSVTKGIVSNAAMILPDMFKRSGGMLLDGEDVGALVRWIGHDAVIFGGNSGGPLVNEQGQIIGINEMGIGSLGGAIPGNLAQAVAQELIETGTVARSWIGMTYQARFPTHHAGVLVGGVLPDSPAQKAGLKSGDLITHFGGTPVDCVTPEDLPVFNAMLLSWPVETPVTVKYERQGQTHEVDILTQLRPQVFLDPKEVKGWGMVARDLTPMLAMELKHAKDRGVFISSMRPGGPCVTAKPALDIGDVIIAVQGQAVDSLEALKAQTKRLLDATDNERATVAVTFLRDHDEYVSVARIGSEQDNRNVATAKKAWLPIRTQVMTRDLIKAMDVSMRRGTRVIQVFKGHSAARAGIEKGDILVKLDGMTIAASNLGDADYLNQMVRQYPVGAKIEIELIRQGETQTVEVELEAAQDTVMQMARYESDLLEMVVRDIAFDDRVDLQLSEDLQGVYIEQVQNAGWADLAGLMSGDLILSVDEVVTPNLATLEQILKSLESSPKEHVMFFVQRGIYTQFIQVKINQD